MKKFIFFFLSSIFMFSSCGTNEKPEIQKIPDTSHVSSVTNTTLNISEVTDKTPDTASLMTGEMRQGMPASPFGSASLLQETGTTAIIDPKKAPVVLTEESIKKVATLDDLKSISPMITMNRNIDNPKFIELQKSQMLLSLDLRKIQNPEYLKLEKERSDIVQGKEIWSADMKNIMDKNSTLSSLMNGSKTSSGDASSILESEKNIITSFYASQEYKTYLMKNQEKINTIDESMKEYWTPEMLELQKNIMSLSKEVNGDIK